MICGLVVVRRRLSSSSAKKTEKTEKTEKTVSFDGVPERRRRFQDSRSLWPWEQKSPSSPSPPPALTRPEVLDDASSQLALFVLSYSASFRPWLLSHSIKQKQSTEPAFFCSSRDIALER